MARGRVNLCLHLHSHDISYRRARSRHGCQRLVALPGMSALPWRLSGGVGSDSGHRGAWLLLEGVCQLPWCRSLAQGVGSGGESRSQRRGAVGEEALERHFHVCPVQGQARQRQNRGRSPGEAEAQGEGRVTPAR